MTDGESSTDVSCTITEEQIELRPADVRETLVDTYQRAVEQPDGFTYVFAGVGEPMGALATFISNERDCCSFASYEIRTEPPYEETYFRVTGPEGTKDLFTENFIDQLEQSLTD